MTLNITCPTDAGIGGTVQMAFGNTASPNANRQTCTSSTGHTLTAGDGTKTVYMAFRDSFGNITSDYIESIILDTTTGTIINVTSEIANGTYSTGNIDIKVQFSEPIAVIGSPVLALNTTPLRTGTFLSQG